MKSPFRAASLLFALVVSSCASPQRPGTPHATRALPRGEVNGETISDFLRDLDELSDGTPERRDVRDAVARYLAARGLEASQTGDQDLAITRLGQAIAHYTPQELTQTVVPNEVAPLARAVLDTASARGDEARALAAARVLMALRTPDASARDTWQRINEWGQRNRTEFQRPWVAEGELAEIYKEIARIIPAQDVLDTAAEHQIARRRAVLEGRARLSRSDAPRLHVDEHRRLQTDMRNASADLAILFLRVGDVREASNRLTALGAGAESSGLASALGSIAQGEGGAEPLWELASALERIDVAAMAGVCRVGRRNFPADRRFAQCLAAAAARNEDYGLASAHLERAATLTGADQRLLREAIAMAYVAQRAEIGSDDLRPGRRAYTRARALLERWRTQYPQQLSPVAHSDIETIAADLELSAGNLRETVDHLTRATQAEPPSRAAFQLLGEIAWRRRDGAEATRRLRAGLALPLRPSESDSLFRPIFTVRLGLAARVSGDDAAARRLFDEAATALDALARSTADHERAEVLLYRAVVADALDDASAARTALEAALEAAPDARDVAARAITFSLARARWSDARDFYRRARPQLTLDRTWQVYFGLWGAIAARAGHLDDDGGARHVLEAVAEQVGEHASWTARLAQRYMGVLDRTRLESYARTPGQRAEAHFYEAMLRLAEGDNTGATEALRAVLATDVMRYWEYEMAWEMLDRQARRAR